jgi:hypothetical protein
MRQALACVRDADPIGLRLSGDAFSLLAGERAIVERKVPLPLRWLKGFAEVQTVLARMTPRLELSGGVLRRLLLELPASWKGDAWLQPVAGGVRLSSTTGAVRVGGAERLRVLLPLARHASSACCFADEQTGSCAWEIVTPDSRFTLALSPQAWRGFSGEGQTLASLAPSKQLRNTAAQRAALGLAGFDLHAQQYFARELPFAPGLIEKLNRRLRDARQLKASVQPDGQRAWVTSGAMQYLVSWDGAGSATCTCAWYARHRNSRGPCKHILAAASLEVGD